MCGVHGSCVIVCTGSDMMSCGMVVIVSAHDGLLRGFTDVIIYVTDINDSAPTFSQSQLSIGVVEHQSDDVIMTLTVHDDDVGHNALVSYRLIGQ